jgi:hypothetical protein
MTPVQTLAAALAAGLLLIAGAAVPVPAEQTKPVCELHMLRSQGETRITAWLRAPDAPVQGTYSLRVTQPGGVTLDQSGDFAAPWGQDVALSEITLNALPKSLNARLSVTVRGRTTVCPIAQAPITL